MHRFSQLLVCLSVLFFGLAGCGDTNRAEISGKVTANGAPVSLGSISFIPDSATGGPDAGSKIVDGKYHIAASDGPRPGKHTVRIIGQRKTGEKMTDVTGEVIDKIELFIPAEFNAQSNLTATIEPGSNKDMDFELEFDED